MKRSARWSPFPLRSAGARYSVKKLNIRSIGDMKILELRAECIVDLNAKGNVFSGRTL